MPVAVSFLRVLASLAVFAGAALRAQQPEELAAWRAWLAKDAPPPSAAELPALLDRLVPLLDSPDPALRDDLAFALLAKWLWRDRAVPIERRRALLATWLARLQVPVADAPADAVVGRSFAALGLSLLVALDNREPWLADAEFAQTLAASTAYLRAETDVRGFDARLGWVHSVAHTADLLKMLARSPHLAPAGQAAMLGAIADKLAAVETPLVAGEDERLARAVVSIAAREDFAADGFRTWLAAAWPAPAAGAAPPTPASLARDHNRRHLFTSLHALLTVDERPALAAARVLVAAHLRERLR